MKRTKISDPDRFQIGLALKSRNFCNRFRIIYRLTKSSRSAVSQSMNATRRATSSTAPVRPDVLEVRMPDPVRNTIIGYLSRRFCVISFRFNFLARVIPCTDRPSPVVPDRDRSIRKLHILYQVYRPGMMPIYLSRTS